jgi:hypothetical protein
VAAVGPDTIRAQLAETQVAALRSERLALLGRLGGQDDELVRLRKLVEALQARLVATEQELARLRADRAQLGLDELVGSIGAAVDRGSDALVGWTVATARADVMARFHVDGDIAGLTLSSPADADSTALSTVSFELRPVPADPVRAALDSALALVRDSVLELQSALTGAEGGERALAAASLLAASTPAPEELRADVASLVKALGELAEVQPGVAGPAAEASLAASALGSSPTVRQLADLAAALHAASTVVAR